MSRALHLDGSLFESSVRLRGRQHPSSVDPQLELSGPGSALCYRPQAVAHLDVAVWPSMRRKKRASLRSEAILVIWLKYLSFSVFPFKDDQKARMARFAQQWLKSFPCR